MSKPLRCAAAALLPPLSVSLIGCVTRQVDIRTRTLFILWPPIICALVCGLLCVLFLCLMKRLLPKGPPDKAMTTAFLAGVLLTLVCVWLSLYGTGDLFPGWTRTDPESTAIASGIWLGSAITYLCRALRRSKA